MKNPIKIVSYMVISIFCLIFIFQIPVIATQASVISSYSNQPASLITIPSFTSYTSNVLVSTDYGLAYLSGQTGLTIWVRSDYSHLTTLNYVIHDDELKIITRDPYRIAVLDPKTGIDQWSREIVIFDEIQFHETFDLGETLAIGYMDNTTFNMVEVETGVDLWSYDSINARNFLKININDDDVDDVLVWADDLLVIDGATGEVLITANLPWSQRYSDLVLFDLGKGLIFAFDSTTTYFGETTESIMGVFNLTSGLPIWTTGLNISVQDIDVGHFTSSNSSNIVLLGTDLSSNSLNIFTFNASDGQPLWNRSLNEGIIDFTLADLNSDGLDEISCIGNSLIVLSNTGDPLWNQTYSGSEVATGYINYDHKPDVIIKDLNGSVTTFSGLSGLALWYADFKNIYSPDYDYYYQTTYLTLSHSSSLSILFVLFLVYGVIIVFIIIIFSIILSMASKHYAEKRRQERYRRSSYPQHRHIMVEFPKSPLRDYKPPYNNVKTEAQKHVPPPITFTSHSVTTCTECYTTLISGSRYCHICGNDVRKTTQYCPSCGNKKEPKYAFCPQCGYRF
ncbi:MAG: zinc ribbon domain-containing protein [Candidatus Hermodarchaeota archaeon]